MTDQNQTAGETERKYAPETRGRPFQPGNPGRPKGALNKTTYALQTLANQNRTMYEAAKILGISKGLVASTARRMNISFHGLRRLHSPAPAETNATAELANGIATTGLVPAAAMDKAVTKQPGMQCMKRRCPACNQIFETTEISDYFCGDCGNASPLAH